MVFPQSRHSPLLRPPQRDENESDSAFNALASSTGLRKTLFRSPEPSPSKPIGVYRTPKSRPRVKRSVTNTYYKEKLAKAKDADSTESARRVNADNGILTPHHLRTPIHPTPSRARAGPFTHTPMGLSFTPGAFQRTGAPPSTPMDYFPQRSSVNGSSGELESEPHHRRLVKMSVAKSHVTPASSGFSIYEHAPRMWLEINAGTLAAWMNHVLAPSVMSLAANPEAEQAQVHRAAGMMYRVLHQDHISRVLQKVRVAIWNGNLSVSGDIALRTNLKSRDDMVQLLLLSYEPIWLLPCLAVVLGHPDCLDLTSLTQHLSLSDSSLTSSRVLAERELTKHVEDVIGTFLLGDKLDVTEYQHTNWQVRKEKPLESTFNAAVLDKVLTIVLVLDSVKRGVSGDLGRGPVLENDPPLFRYDSKHTSSKAVLHALTSMFLHSNGNVERTLKTKNYCLSYQAPVFESRGSLIVENFSHDISDGTRLCKLVALLCGQPSMLENVLIPSQAMTEGWHNACVHNLKTALRGLQRIAEQGSTRLSAMKSWHRYAEDIAKEKEEISQQVVWDIAWAWVDSLVVPNFTTVSDEVERLHQEFRKRRKEVDPIGSAVHQAELTSTPGLRMFLSPSEATNKEGHGASNESNMMLAWCTAVCMFYGKDVREWTESFCDGSVLCFLIHFYRPGLINLADVRLVPAGRNCASETSQDTVAIIKTNFDVFAAGACRLGGIPSIPISLQAVVSSPLGADKPYAFGRQMQLIASYAFSRLVCCDRGRNGGSPFPDFDAFRESVESATDRVFMSEALEENQRRVSEMGARMMEEAMRDAERERLEEESRQMKNIQIVRKNASKNIYNAVLCWWERKRFLALKKAVRVVEAFRRAHLLAAVRDRAAMTLEAALRAHSFQVRYQRRSIAAKVLQNPIARHLKKREMDTVVALATCNKARQCAGENEKFCSRVQESTQPYGYYVERTGAALVLQLALLQRHARDACKNQKKRLFEMLNAKLVISAALRHGKARHDVDNRRIAMAERHWIAKKHNWMQRVLDNRVVVSSAIASVLRWAGSRMEMDFKYQQGLIESASRSFWSEEQHKRSLEVEGQSGMRKIMAQSVQREQRLEAQMQALLQTIKVNQIVEERGREAVERLEAQFVDIEQRLEDHIKDRLETYRQEQALETAQDRSERQRHEEFTHECEMYAAERRERIQQNQQDEFLSLIHADRKQQEGAAEINEQQNAKQRMLENTAAEMALDEAEELAWEAEKCENLVEREEWTGDTAVMDEKLSHVVTKVENLVRPTKSIAENSKSSGADQVLEEPSDLAESYEANFCGVASGAVSDFCGRSRSSGVTQVDFVGFPDGNIDVRIEHSTLHSELDQSRDAAVHHEAAGSTSATVDYAGKLVDSNESVSTQATERRLDNDVGLGLGLLAFQDEVRKPASRQYVVSPSVRKQRTSPLLHASDYAHELNGDGMADEVGSDLSPTGKRCAGDLKLVAAQPLSGTLAPEGKYTAIVLAAERCREHRIPSDDHCFNSIDTQASAQGSGDIHVGDEFKKGAKACFKSTGDGDSLTASIPPNSLYIFEEGTAAESAVDGTALSETFHGFQDEGDSTAGQPTDLQETPKFSRDCMQWNFPYGDTSPGFTRHISEQGASGLLANLKNPGVDTITSAEHDSVLSVLVDKTTDETLRAPVPGDDDSNAQNSSNSGTWMVTSDPARRPALCPSPNRRGRQVFSERLDTASVFVQNKHSVIPGEVLLECRQSPSNSPDRGQTVHAIKEDGNVQMPEERYSGEFTWNDQAMPGSFATGRNERLGLSLPDTVAVRDSIGRGQVAPEASEMHVTFEPQETGDATVQGVTPLGMEQRCTSILNIAEGTASGDTGERETSPLAGKSTDDVLDCPARDSISVSEQDRGIAETHSDSSVRPGSNTRASNQGEDTVCEGLFSTTSLRLAAKNSQQDLDLAECSDGLNTLVAPVEAAVPSCVDQVLAGKATLTQCREVSMLDESSQTLAITNVRQSPPGSSAQTRMCSSEDDTSGNIRESLRSGYAASILGTLPTAFSRSRTPGKTPSTDMQQAEEIPCFADNRYESWEALSSGGVKPNTILSTRDAIVASTVPEQTRQSALLTQTLQSLFGSSHAAASARYPVTDTSNGLYPDHGRLSPPEGTVPPSPARLSGQIMGHQGAIEMFAQLSNSSADKAHGSEDIPDTTDERDTACGRDQNRYGYMNCSSRLGPSSSPIIDDSETAAQTEVMQCYTPTAREAVNKSEGVVQPSSGNGTFSKGTSAENRSRTPNYVDIADDRSFCSEHRDFSHQPSADGHLYRVTPTACNALSGSNADPSMASVRELLCNSPAGAARGEVVSSEIRAYLDRDDELSAEKPLEQIGQTISSQVSLGEEHAEESMSTAYSTRNSHGSNVGPDVRDRSRTGGKHPWQWPQPPSHATKEAVRFEPRDSSGNTTRAENYLAGASSIELAVNSPDGVECLRRELENVRPDGSSFAKSWSNGEASHSLEDGDVLSMVLSILRLWNRSSEHLSLVGLCMEIISDMCLFPSGLRLLREAEDSMDIITSCLQMYRDVPQIFETCVLILIKCTMNVEMRRVMNGQKKVVCRLNAVYQYASVALERERKNQERLERANKVLAELGIEVDGNNRAQSEDGPELFYNGSVVAQLFDVCDSVSHRQECAPGSDANV